MAQMSLVAATWATMMPPDKNAWIAVAYAAINETMLWRVVRRRMLAARLVPISRTRAAANVGGPLHIPISNQLLERHRRLISTPMWSASHIIDVVMNAKNLRAKVLTTIGRCFATNRDIPGVWSRTDCGGEELPGSASTFNPSR